MFSCFVFYIPAEAAGAAADPGAVEGETAGDRLWLAVTRQRVCSGWSSDKHVIGFFVYRYSLLLV